MDDSWIIVKYHEHFFFSDLYLKTTVGCIPLCPIHVVTFTLTLNLATDCIQKRRGEPSLFSFEYNLSPNLISK